MSQRRNTDCLRGKVRQEWGLFWEGLVKVYFLEQGASEKF